MKGNTRRFMGWLGRALGTKFGIGFITVVPTGVTIWILYWGFNTVDNFLQPFIKTIWGHTIPGVGFGVTVVLIFLIGFIASNVIGRRMIRYGESALPWLPLIGSLYSGIKQIMESFSAPKEKGRMQPVLTEFPRKGLRTIGFITNEIQNESGKKLFTVFIPTSPNPTSGFLQIVEEKDITRTNMSVDSALKMVVSAGKVLPREVVDILTEAG
ncbi:DUF502 domain-containing protein [Chloroflexota bacterium]